jgi:methionyl aminopeptidase
MNQNFVNGMRKAGKLAALVLKHVIAQAKEGVSTNQLDLIADAFTLANGGTSACIGYKGYPKATCISLNGILCHGVPDETVLKSGDILNIDVTVKVGEYYGDTSASIGIGDISEEARAIISAAKGARDAGILAVRPYGRTGDIGHSSSSYIKKHYPQFLLNKDIGGHGIGKVFHDKPFVPAVGMFGTGETIKPWTCLTVEPIVCQTEDILAEKINPAEGHSSCGVLLFKAKYGLAAQFEHTILVTDTGYEILTEIKDN